jgi:hypothetical protein
MPSLSTDEKMKIVILSFDPNANLQGILKKYDITRPEFREMKELFLKGARKALSTAPRDRDTQEIRRSLEQIRKDLTRFVKRGDGDSGTGKKS